jgi:hypothetical protein
MTDDSPERQRRWHEGGWQTYKAAHRAFTQVLSTTVQAGAKPGDPLPLKHHDALLWLLSGHPARPVLPVLVSHFTFAHDGRGHYRFVAVDNFGIQHPFSLRAALTGRAEPLREPTDNPFAGLRA